MLPSIAASSSGHWNHDASRRWQRSMRPPHRCAATPARRRGTLRPAPCLRRGPVGSTATRTSPSGMPLKHLLDQRQALLDLLDADPDARVDVALRQHRHLEAAAGRTADSRSTGARRNRGRRRGRHSRRRRSAAPVRPTGCRCRPCGPAATRSCRRAATSGGKRARISSISARIRAAPSADRSTATPPGTMQSIIRRWPKQAAAQRSTRSRSMPQCASMMLNDASLQIAPKSPR